MPLASIQSFLLNGWGPAAASPVSCPVVTVGTIGHHSAISGGQLAALDMDEVLASVSSGTRSTSTQGTEAEVVC